MTKTERTVASVPKHYADRHGCTGAQPDGAYSHFSGYAMFFRRRDRRRQQRSFWMLQGRLRAAAFLLIHCYRRPRPCTLTDSSCLTVGGFIIVENWFEELRRLVPTN